MERKGEMFIFRLQTRPAAMAGTLGAIGIGFTQSNPSSARRRGFLATCGREVLTSVGADTKVNFSKDKSIIMDEEFEVRDMWPRQ